MTADQLVATRNACKPTHKFHVTVDQTCAQTDVCLIFKWLTTDRFQARPRRNACWGRLLNVFQTVTIIQFNGWLTDWWNCFDEAVLSLHTHIPGLASAWPRPYGLPGLAMGRRERTLWPINLFSRFGVMH